MTDQTSTSTSALHGETDAAEGSDELSPPERRRPRRRSRRKAGLAVLIALLALSLMGGAAALGISVAYDRLTAGTEDFDGPAFGSTVIQIETGDSVRAIGRTLAGAGVVQTEGALVAAARDNPAATSLQPGFYRVKLGMPAADALDLLLDPSARILARLAVPEGFTVKRIVDRIARETSLPRRDLRTAVANPGDLGLPRYANGEVEGFLFPATYDVEPDATPTSVLSSMVDRFDQAAREVDLVERAKAVGLSPRQVVVIASLIQSEASATTDMGKVSRVIYNRLAKGMKLQFDSTVHYVVGSKGTVTTTQAERQVDSPYNTYRFAGLPPGPISSPGTEALRAALNPTPGDWLYFVTVNIKTGETKFAETAEQHQRNVAEFRRNTDRE